MKSGDEEEEGVQVLHKKDLISEENFQGWTGKNPRLSSTWAAEERSDWGVGRVTEKAGTAKKKKTCPVVTTSGAIGYILPARDKSSERGAGTVYAAPNK